VWLFANLVSCCLSVKLTFAFQIRPNCSISPFLSDIKLFPFIPSSEKLTCVFNKTRVSCYIPLWGKQVWSYSCLCEKWNCHVCFFNVLFNFLNQNSKHFDKCQSWVIFGPWLKPYWHETYTLLLSVHILQGGKS